MPKKETKHWLVQTWNTEVTPPKFMHEYDRFFGPDEDRAREELLKDRDIPQFWTRYLISFDNDPNIPQVEKQVTHDERKITRKLLKPVILDGWALKNLREWQKLGDKIAQALAEQQTTNESMDYIKFEEGMISYLPDGKKHVEDEDLKVWLPQGRQSAKPGKILRQIIHPDLRAKFTDAEYEATTNRIKAVEATKNCTIHVVHGEDVRYWYLEENYERDRNSSTLHHSCMRYDRAQEWIQIYADNPEKVGLVILTNAEGKLVARALIWQLDTGETYVDRVYGPDSVARAFQKWAGDNRYCMRGIRARDGDGDTLNPPEVLFVSLQKWMYSTYPHIDSFHYLNTKIGRLCSSPSYFHHYQLASAGGVYSEVKTSGKSFLDDENGKEREAVDSCSQCAKKLWYREDVFTGLDKLSYCHGCYSTKYVHCLSCDKVVIRTESHYMNRYYYCLECKNKLFATCDRCTSTVERKRVVVHDGKNWCASCYATYFRACYTCGVVMDKHRINSVGICSECADKRVKRTVVRSAEAGEPEGKVRKWMVRNA